MSFSGSQGADLMQAALAGSYDWYLEREGVWLGGTDDSINIPWILGLAISEGNASTKAIGEGAWTYPEPEWGFDASGGQDTRLQQWMGGGVGGWIRSW